MFKHEDIEKIFTKLKNKKMGKNAEYIPELKKVDPSIYSISICNIHGESFDIGDYTTKIAIESVSKTFTLALALKKHNIQKVIHKIGIDQSNLAFNSIQAIESSDSHTINPFVNAGAMATTSLLYNPSLSEKQNDKIMTKKIIDNMNLFANKHLSINDKIYHSEMETIHHNKSIAYLLYSYNRFYGNVDTVVDVYTKQCSVMVTSKDVALMAATIANHGVNPISKKKCISKEHSEFIVQMLIKGGLYNYSSEFFHKTHMPAKSGVGGIIMIVLPGIMGIAIVSPPLDKNGNSAKGIKTAELLSKCKIY